MNENLTLLLAHLRDPSLAKSIVQALIPAEESAWDRTIREAVVSRIATQGGASTPSADAPQ